MKKLYLFFGLLVSGALAFAQDTFSIVAVDSVTGEIGSAGASCLQAPNPPTGCLIISDIVPGMGAIHTQALWNANNQANARQLMQYGYLPDELLAQVNIEDDGGDSTIRQYGVAMFDGGGHVHTGAFTGTGCYDYKNHIKGTYYTVQGNILLGQYILDSIEARFLRTPGQLVDRLMAALQGANVAGADSRCMAEGVPAQSAFVRVAKPTDYDDPDSFYVNLKVISRPYGISPVDSLQTLYNAWRLAHPVISSTNDIVKEIIHISPNPANSICHIQMPGNMRREVIVYDLLGKQVYTNSFTGYCQIPLIDWQRGVYFIRVGNSVGKLLLH